MRTAAAHARTDQPRAYDERMKRRITVSLPPALVAEARAAVRARRAPSISAYVEEALRASSGRDPLLEWLDEMDRELGPPGPEADTWARRVLGLSSSTPAR